MSASAQNKQPRKPNAVVAPREALLHPSLTFWKPVDQLHVKLDDITDPARPRLKWDADFAFPDVGAGRNLSEGHAPVRLLFEGYF